MIIPLVDRMAKVDLRVEPTDARGYWNRAVVHAALGKVTEAIADLNNCINLNPPKDEEPRGPLSMRFSHESTSQETKWLMEQHGKAAETRVLLPEKYIVSIAYRRKDRESGTDELTRILADSQAELLEDSIAEHEWAKGPAKTPPNPNLIKGGIKTICSVGIDLHQGQHKARCLDDRA